MRDIPHGVFDLENTIRLNVIRKAGLALLILFAFSVFISKAAVNIFSGAALFFSLLDILVNGTYKELVKNRLFLALILPLLLGLALSLFSDAGLDGPAFFLSRYRFFFMVLPFMAFIREKKHLYSLFVVLSLSGCLAVVYGFVQAHLAGSGLYFEGLLIVGRNSDLLASLCLINTVLLFELVVEDSLLRFVARTGLLISIGLFVAAILVISQRGAMLGLYVGWVFYALIFNRKFLFGLIIVSVAGFMLVSKENYVLDRIKSIGDLKTNTSNLARIHLLYSGIPYVIEHHLITGTGDKNSEKDFTDFFMKQDKSFQTKYSSAMDYPGNFHNSFLQMAVEGGAMFLAAYLAGIGFILFHMVERLHHHENTVFGVGALAVTAGAFVTYFFHGELYRYGGVVFYMVLMSGCIHEKKSEKKVGAQIDVAQQKPALYGSQGPISPAV